MAQKPDGKAAKTERVTFTRQAAERIAKVVRTVESGDRKSEPLRFGARLGGSGKAIVLGKTVGVWQKGTLASVQVFSEGAPPNEIEANPPELIPGCVNKFATVGDDKWVAIAMARNGSWYLIAAEC